jgi:hypothetical protein
MAFVAISRDFMQRVENKIEHMRRAEVKTLGENRPELAMHATDPFFMQTVWQEHAPLQAQMPKEWVNHQEYVRFKFKIPGAERIKEHHNWFEFRAVCTNKDGFPIPPRYSSYDEKECDATHPMVAGVLDYALKLNEIDSRWETVNSKVTNFLRACKSANEAIKLWPDVKTYFAAEDVERLDKKAVRAGSSDSSAAQALAGIDTGEIMSAAVIARLSGAQV